MGEGRDVRKPPGFPTPFDRPYESHGGSSLSFRRHCLSGVTELRMKVLRLLLLFWAAAAQAERFELAEDKSCKNIITNGNVARGVRVLSP